MAASLGFLHSLALMVPIGAESDSFASRHKHESRETNQILPAFRRGIARRALCCIPR